MGAAGVGGRHPACRLSCRGPHAGAAPGPRGIRGGVTEGDSTVSDTHSGRVGFGQRLRRLRQDADLSGKQLAELLRWPASKVSRLEHGRQTASPTDVELWTAATAAGAAVREELIADLRSLRVEYATWRRQLSNGFAPRQRVNRLIESDTLQLRALVAVSVPGLLQTADYARALYEQMTPVWGPRDVEAGVHERLRRQEVLYQQQRSFRWVVTESALRTRVGGTAVHRAQLERLLGLSGLKNVDIAVLPWSTEETPPVFTSFDIFDDRLVLVETFNAELAIREPDDVALYARVFDLYWDAALHGSEATTLIARIALEIE